MKKKFFVAEGIKEDKMLIVLDSTMSWWVLTPTYTRPDKVTFHAAEVMEKVKQKIVQLQILNNP